MKALIDSDVLIDYLQGVPQARKEISRYSELLYSIVSWMEIMCGADTQQEIQAAQSLLDSMTCVDLTPDIAAKAVEVRKDSKLKLPDAIILATADRSGCILVTRNTRDFDKRDPRIRFPYNLSP